MQGSPAPVDILRSFVPQKDGPGAPVAGWEAPASASVAGGFSGILAMLVTPQTNKSTPTAQGGPQSDSTTTSDAGVGEDTEADETNKTEVTALSPNLLIQGTLTLPPQTESALVLSTPPEVQPDANVPSTIVGTTASTSQTVPTESGEPARVQLAESLLATMTAVSPDAAEHPFQKQPGQSLLETRPEQISTPAETAPEPSSGEIQHALPEQTDQPTPTPVVLDKAVSRQVAEAANANMPNAGGVNRSPAVKPAVEPSLPPSHPSREEARTAAAPQQAQQAPQVTGQASELVVPVLPSANPQRDVPTETPITTSAAAINPLPDGSVGSPTTSTAALRQSMAPIQIAGENPSETITQTKPTVVPEVSTTVLETSRSAAAGSTSVPIPPVTTSVAQSQFVPALQGQPPVTSAATAPVATQQTPETAASAAAQASATTVQVPPEEQPASRSRTTGDSAAIGNIDSGVEPPATEVATPGPAQRPQERQQHPESQAESSQSETPARDAATPRLSPADSKRSEAVYRQVARDASTTRISSAPALSVAGVEWNPPLEAPSKGSTNSSNAATTGVDGVSVAQTGAATTTPTGPGMPAIVAPTSSLISTPDAPQMRSDFVAQAVTLIESVPAGDEQRVMMRLDPPELGRVLIRIRRSSERLSVHMESDSARTLSVLREQHGQLVASLTNGMSDSGQIDLSYSDGQQQGREQAEERMSQLTLFPIDSEASGSGSTVPAQQELNFVA